MGWKIRPRPRTVILSIKKLRNSHGHFKIKQRQLGCGQCEKLVTHTCETSTDSFAEAKSLRHLTRQRRWRDALVRCHLCLFYIMTSCERQKKVLANKRCDFFIYKYNTYNVLFRPVGCE